MRPSLAASPSGRKPLSRRQLRCQKSLRPFGCRTRPVSFRDPGDARVVVVNSDQSAGLAKQMKGSVKHAAGKASGNRRTQVEGAADKLAGKVQSADGDVTDKIKKAFSFLTHLDDRSMEAAAGRPFHGWNCLAKALVKTISPWSPAASPSTTSMLSAVMRASAKPPI
ncbi:MAG: CsbD family protein [Mesorhizobium sp.]|nr:MAG: CsbD family protein [Mesorhizobium sp.]TIP42196.1 MAG: CsbD family protein [Mesorhizobium sp.]